MIPTRMFYLGFSGVTVTSDPIDTDEIRDVRSAISSPLIMIGVRCRCCRFSGQPGGLGAGTSGRSPWREVRQRAADAEGVDAARSAVGDRRPVPGRRVPLRDVVDAVVPRRRAAGRLSSLCRPPPAAPSRRPRTAPVFGLRGRVHRPPALRPPPDLRRPRPLGGLHVAAARRVRVLPVRHRADAGARRSRDRKASHRVRTRAAGIRVAAQVRHRVCRHHVPPARRRQGDLSAERMAGDVYGAGSLCARLLANVTTMALAIRPRDPGKIPRGIRLMLVGRCRQWDV